MTTIQAILYALVHGFAEFLPISAGAHHLALPYLTGWPIVEGALAGALSLGSLLALLLYFRHDWASIFSSFLQVILFRKKPMTLDERLPIFMLVSSLPSFLVWFYFKDTLAGFFGQPLWIAALLVAAGGLLQLADSTSRKNKGMFDWTFTDCLVIGIAQTLMWVPGVGRITAALMGAHVRNFNRESAAKYAFYLALPSLAASTWIHMRGISFGAHEPMPETSWLTWCVTVIFTAGTGLLAIGGLMKNTTQRGYQGYWIYRVIVAATLAVVYWLRARAGA